MDIREEAMASVYLDARNELIQRIKHDPFSEEFSVLLRCDNYRVADEIVRRFALEGIMARHEPYGTHLNTKFYVIPPISPFVSFSNQPKDDASKKTDFSSEGLSKRKSVLKSDLQ